MSDPHVTDSAHASVATHDASHDAEHIAKHLKGYYIVGATLIVFTGITVALSYIDFDGMFGGRGWNFIIAMVVATFKVCLVGAIFMHLKGERWTIWQFLLFTVFFFAGMFLLTLFSWGDPIWGTHHTIH